MQYTKQISITIRSLGRMPKKMRVTAGRSTQYLNWTRITDNVNRLITWNNNFKQDKYRTKYRLHFLQNPTPFMVWYCNCKKLKY